MDFDTWRIMRPINQHPINTKFVSTYCAKLRNKCFLELNYEQI